MSLMSRIWLRMRRSALDLSDDTRGLAAVEFAMVVPLMLVLFFGTVEFSSGVAVDRKVTLMARTLSDLTSQNVSVTDAQLTNIFNASTGIMTPYSATPLNSTITELYVDPTTKIARVQWSKGAAPRGTGSTVAISGRAAGRRHLSDLQRGQLQIRPGHRLCDGEGGNQFDRFHLYAPAPVDLRDVQHHGLHKIVSVAFSSEVVARFA
ncbi:Flp pilus assembly protein TadG [Bradyrhizobium sp. OAE829]